MLGCGRAGPGNWERAGLNGAFEAYASALNEALDEAGLCVGDLSGAGYGLSGLDWPSDAARLRPVVDRLGVPGPAALVNDTFAALRAGSRDGTGVAVISGTGSNVAGRNRRGETFHTFGLGAYLGDFGSAGDLVFLASRAAAYAYIGRGPETALTGLFLHASGSPTFEAYAERITREAGPLPDGRLAPQVFQIAAAGDAVAREVIATLGQELGKNALAVAARLGLVNEPFDLVLAGGVFRSRSRILFDALLAEVQRGAPQAALAPLECAPVVGSALLALEAAGLPVTPELHAHLKVQACSASRLAK